MCIFFYCCNPTLKLDKKLLNTNTSSVNVLDFVYVSNNTSKRYDRKKYRRAGPWLPCPLALLVIASWMMMS